MALALVGAELASPTLGRRLDHGLLIDDGGRIVAIGPSREIVDLISRPPSLDLTPWPPSLDLTPWPPSLQGRGEEGRRGAVIDLAGATVVPGFIDTHVHVLQTGLAESTLDFDGCRRLAEVLDLVAGAASEPGGEWILGRRLDDFKLEEKRPPSAAELDRVARGRPVYLDHRSLHYAVVNRAALAALGLGKADLPPEPFAGLLRGRPLQVARQRLMASIDPATKATALRRAAEKAARVGVTTLHAIEGGELFGDQDIPLILSLRDQLAAHLVLYWSTTDVAAAAAAGLRSVGGDVLLDGTLGSQTAALSQPYADQPATSGSLYRPFQAVAGFFRAAHAAGLQAAAHAIGDRAISQALDAYELVLREAPRADLRHRIEHFGLPTPRDVERAAHLGVAVATQPAFALLRGGPGSVYEARLGPERERRAYPLRELLDAGVLVAGGSDSEVTPLDPLLGLHACVNHPHPAQRLAAREALALFTVNGARIAFAEERCGDLRVGLDADLAVLDANPLTCPGERLRELKVLMTLKQGHIVYRSHLAPPPP